MRAKKNAAADMNTTSNITMATQSGANTQACIMPNRGGRVDGYKITYSYVTGQNCHRGNNYTRSKSNPIPNNCRWMNKRQKMPASLA